ncbi:MAG TPA: class III poly(R)-hydroxyalkanoic acid synthase subunit PhaC [Isosphaeraceae bacterium]|jgi:polyhydroxyalkanoate synthase
MAANPILDFALGQQKAWLEQALAQQKAVYDETLKMWSRLLAVPRAVEWARDVKVGTTPHDVVYEEDTLRLLHYRSEAPAKYAEPVLICYALVNRPYIVDLQSDRSVIRQFLARGLDVYLIDWGVPSAADRGMRLADYIDGLMKNCADAVVRQAGTPNLHLVGYCMGGTMSAIFTTRYPELVKTLTLMTAPLDFSVGGDKSLVQFWSNPEYFDIDALVDAFGNIPAEFLQYSFQMMKPVQNYYQKYVTFYEKLDDEKFVENYFAMEKWTNDNIPVAGETFREFVKKLYQRNELVRGEFRLVAGEPPIDLKRITCPLMLLTASADHLVPPEQSTNVIPYVGSTDIKNETLEAGHIGLAVSTKAHKKFWPAATQWLADRSSPKAL